VSAVTATWPRARIVLAPAAGMALVVLGAALWGIDGPFRTPMTSRWDSTTIVLYEHIILTVVALPYLWRHRAVIRRLSPGAWVAVLVIAWGASALATVAFTAALNTEFKGGNPNVVFLLQKTQPLWAIGLAAVVVREYPLPRFAALLVPALVGTYLLTFGFSDPSFQGGQARSAALALLAAALWGAGTALGRRVLIEVPSDALMALRFSLAMPFLLVIALIGGDAAPPSDWHQRDIVRLLIIALVPGFIAIVLYYRGLVRTPAPVATICELAFPATALLVNYHWLGFGLTWSQFLGFAVIWVTIVLLHYAPIRIQREAPEAAT
jgi:drug/metabolite transporter (DMT)-like permease